MVNILRKYQQGLMIFVTVMVIIAFILLYNGTRFDKIGADQAYRVYNRTLSQADIQRAARRSQLALALGLKELVGGLGGGSSQEQALENFVWNSFVLEHEAKALGVQPTDAAVAASLEQLPAFQTNKTFDSGKYQAFLQNLLYPNGFNDAQLEDLIRDDLKLKKLIELVGTAVEVTPEEAHMAYVQNHEKMNVSLVRFSVADFASSVQPTDAEIKKFFEDRKSTFVTEEKRVVSYVQLGLADSEKQLKGKEKVDVLQKLADRANDLGQVMLEPNADFQKAAGKLGLKVLTTPEFTEQEPAPGISTPAVLAEAFRLSEKEPNSNAVQVDSGFYILHLDKLVPSRPLSEVEARPKVIEQIKLERGHDALVSRANEVRPKLQMLAKQGKSFSDAAKAENLKVETFPSFSLSEPVTDRPEANDVIGKAIELADGDTSELIPTADGGILVHLDKREPIDEAAYAKDQESFMTALRVRKRVAAFHEWLVGRRKGATIQNLQEQAPRSRG